MTTITTLPKPRTFVLVHGAWHGGWCWARVAARLRAGGHHVFTPTLTGLGEREHLLSRSITLEMFATDIVNVIKAEELHDVTLVGHSFAGSTVSAVAEWLPGRVAGLIYLDALMIEPGRTAFDALSPAEVELRRETAERTTGGLALPPPPPETFGIVEPDDAAWLHRRLTSQPFSVYSSVFELSGPIGAGLPAVYVSCVDPEYRSLAPSKARARQLPNIIYTEKSWSHDPMITNVNELSDFLLVRLDRQCVA